MANGNKNSLWTLDPTSQQGMMNTMAIGGMVAGIPGMIGGYAINQMGQGQAAQAGIEDKTSAIRERIGERPLYEIPEETKRLMELYGQTAEQMTSTSQQALDAAQARTGVAEAPGAAIAREQARAAAAGTRRDVMEAGGASASSLGAIVKAGQSEMGALRDIAIQNQQYRSQAEQQYINQLGSHAGVLGSAAQLEGAGLGAMAAERGAAYQSELGQYQDLTQFDITQLGNEWAADQARQARNAQYVSAGIGALGSIGGALAGM